MFSVVAFHPLHLHPFSLFSDIYIYIYICVWGGFIGRILFFLFVCDVYSLTVFAII